MAYVDIIDATLAVKKPMTRSLIRQFRMNDDENSIRIIKMKFSQVQTNSTSYVEVYSRKIYIPKSAIYFRTIIQLCVTVDGTNYTQLNINDSIYSDEQNHNGLTYLDKTFTFTNVASFAGQVVNLNVRAKLVGATGGFARDYSPVDYRSYFSRT